MKNNYLQILEEYQKFNIKLVYKEFGYKYFWYILIFLGLIFLSLGLISILILDIYKDYMLSSHKFISDMFVLLSSILAVVCIFYIYFNIKHINNNAQTKFSNYKYFIKDNNFNYRGVRWLMFCKSISEKHLEIDKELIDFINQESKYKQFSLWKMPLLVASVSIIGLLINNILLKMELNSLLALFFIVITITLLLYVVSLLLYSKQMQTQELKLFILWYKELYK